MMAINTLLSILQTSTQQHQQRQTSQSMDVRVYNIVIETSDGGGIIYKITVPWRQREDPCTLGDSITTRNS